VVPVTAPAAAEVQQESPAPARRATRLRSGLAAACVAAGLLAVLGMLGADLWLPHPKTPAGFLLTAFLGLALAGSWLSPGKARS
jgi:hypothetical protein